jgi:hypothetical protein
MTRFNWDLPRLSKKKKRSIADESEWTNTDAAARFLEKREFQIERRESVKARSVRRKKRR